MITIKFSYKKSISLLLSAILIQGMLLAGTRPTTRYDIIKDRGNLKLAYPGIKGAVPYEKYGKFEGLGTKNYRYAVKDKEGLAQALGEGIFPNSMVTRDPRYKELLSQGKLVGNQWDFADRPDSEIGFYKWASASEEPGLKQFYSAVMLERSGYMEEAIKAYYAVAVHFPRTTSSTYYKTPWYVAPAALDRIRQLLRRHPEINMDLVGGRIHIEGRYDNDSKNDVYFIDPGKLVNVKKRKTTAPIVFKDKDIVKRVAGPDVQLVKFKNGHWQLRVEGKPYPIRAITYSVTPIGASPDRGTWNPSQGWQTLDGNSNGLHDGFFESYIDTACATAPELNQPRIGDAQLLKDMGVNTLRAYHHIVNKELFRKLYKDYGFRVICGDVLGGYAIGSGASWYEGTDYTNPEQREKMLASVRQMVEENKDEPYVLMWMIGNENIYGAANNSPTHPEEFYKLVNEAAQLIHKLDPTRPVAVANGDLLHFDMLAKLCPDVDIMGANAYRGEHGFGQHMFMDVKDLYDKPFMVTEYGVSAYADGYTKEEQEAYQAVYLGNNWDDLEANMAGQGVGNCLGGVLYEFLDEWWKANSDLPLEVQKAKGKWYEERSAIYKNLQPQNHDTVPQFGFPFLDGWSYEEWYGVMSQGEGKASPFCRVIRPAYNTLKELWNTK